MERRAFLGAAAALSGLPALNGEAETGAVRGEPDDTNPSARNYPKRTGDMAEVRVPNRVDHDDPDVRVRAHCDDEWGEHSVDFRANVGDRHFWMVLNPESAAEFAEDLAEAAEYAAGGEGDGA